MHNILDTSSYTFGAIYVKNADANVNIENVIISNCKFNLARWDNYY